MPPLSSRRWPPGLWRYSVSSSKRVSLTAIGKFWGSTPFSTLLNPRSLRTSHSSCSCRSFSWRRWPCSGRECLAS
ncbi:MAG: SWIM zinc finger family protein [Actinobacteria bacterium]|nr:SWIM zinc finger family protein [Actinomycetota bacterium]